MELAISLMHVDSTVFLALFLAFNLGQRRDMERSPGWPHRISSVFLRVASVLCFEVYSE